MTAHDPPTPQGGDPDLLGELVARIGRCGSIPFDEFMDLALYRARGGYYERGASAIGRSGDFYTASDASSAFGQLLAEQIAELQSLTGEGRFDLVELGAGKGTMAADILERLRSRHREVYRHLTYWIIDRSSAMRSAQRRAVGEHALAGKVRWARGPDEIRSEGITGCIIANEFYDALPVRVVTRRDGVLLERRVGVSSDPSRLAWIDLPATHPELLEYAATYGLAPTDGSVAEAGLEARAYARRVARSILKGFQIVIDYGDRAGALYDAAIRPAGTLLAYHRHRTSEDPFSRVGGQDLTSHVNFTALEDAGREEGLRTAGFTTQDRFLIALGLADQIAGLANFTDPADVSRRLAMMSLIHPEGMGGIFRVLVQVKGVAAFALRGLQDPFASAWTARSAAREDRR